MTQDQDLYAIKNDGRGWRIVTEADLAEFIRRTKADVTTGEDGFGLYAGHDGQELAYGCSLKFPLSQLKHRIDDELRKVFVTEIAGRQGCPMAA